MKIENTEIFGFRAAMRAMRNPMDSWHKSDSVFWSKAHSIAHEAPEQPHLGPKDLNLACKLIGGGGVHRKFLRQIIVWVDFTLPRYVWCEMDTYKVATVRNSCSTMHKLGHRELTPDDFEGGVVLESTLDALNAAGDSFRAPSKEHVIPAVRQCRTIKGYDIVRYMKAILPESFLQRSTWTGSYETLLGMYQWRHNHRLPEWSGPGGICEWIKSLPYMSMFLDAFENKPERG